MNYELNNIYVYCIYSGISLRGIKRLKPYTPKCLRIKKKNSNDYLLGSKN